MNKEKLDALLASGAITQEEYDAMLAALPGEPPPEDGGGQKPGGRSNPPDDDDDDELDRRVQRAVDKITAKLGKDKAALQKELDRLKKEKLTDEERAALDQKERDDALAQRERALQEKENRLYAIGAIKKAGLDDGSDAALSLVDFVLGEDEADIDRRVKTFGALMTKMVRAEVDRRFREGGREPQKGGGDGGGEPNPYSKATFNLTAQMELETKDPQKAERLRAAAQQ